MRCETCGAPAVLLKNACVFCRTPIADSHAPIELLTYLESRLPAARAKRFGIVRRGQVRAFDLRVGESRFRARALKGALVLDPDLPPAQWVDALLKALSVAAASDPSLRARLSRSGWLLR